MSYHKDCLDKFSQLPKDIREKIGSYDNVLIISALEDEYLVELGFLVILVAIGEIAIEDIPDYLVKTEKIDYEKAELIKSELVQSVFGTLVDSIEIDIIKFEHETNDIFNNKLVDILLAEEESQIEINAKILFLLTSSKSEFQDELARSMLANKEILTHQPFVLDDKQKNPTVGAWLGYFIKEEGSAMPTNVSISNFLINSKNAKVLNDEDRDALGKMLILYRNLKFFPESMGDMPVEDWYFVPVEKSETLLKAREVSGPPKTEEEEKIEELKQREEQYGDESLERRVVDEEGVKNARRIEDLKYMMSKFADGSLEKKAIEEEIRKLEKKIDNNKEE